MDLGETVSAIVLLGLVVLGPATAICFGVASALSSRLRTELGKAIPAKRAAAGVVLYVALVVTVVFLGDFPNWGNRSPASVCLNNARTIGLACIGFAQEHDGRLPESFGMLLKEGYLNSTQTFFCPSTFNRLPADFPADYRAASLEALRGIDEASDYVLVKGGGPGESNERVLLYEKDPGHGSENWHNIVFSDGHVKLVKGLEFRELMAKERAR